VCVRARAYMYSHAPAALFMCKYIHEAVHNLAASSDTCHDVTHVACVLTSGVCCRLSLTHTLSLPLYARVFICMYICLFIRTRVCIVRMYRNYQCKTIQSTHNISILLTCVQINIDLHRRMYVCNVCV